VTAATPLSPGARRPPSPLSQKESCFRPSQRRRQQLRETGFVTRRHCWRPRPRGRRRGVDRLVGRRLRVGRGAVGQRRRTSPSRPRRDVCGHRWLGRGVSTRESVRVGGVRCGNRRGCGRLGRFEHGGCGRRRGGRRATGAPPLPPPSRPSCARLRPAAKTSAVDDRRTPRPRAATTCRASPPPVDDATRQSSSVRSGDLAGGDDALGDETGADAPPSAAIKDAGPDVWCAPALTCPGAIFGPMQPAMRRVLHRRATTLRAWRRVAATPSRRRRPVLWAGERRRLRG